MYQSLSMRVPHFRSSQWNIRWRWSLRSWSSFHCTHRPPLFPVACPSLNVSIPVLLDVQSVVNNVQSVVNNSIHLDVSVLSNRNRGSVNESFISWSNNNQSISHGNHSVGSGWSLPSWNVSHPLNGSQAAQNNSIHLNVSESSISWSNNSQSISHGNHSVGSVWSIPAWHVSHPLNDNQATHNISVPLQSSWVINNNSTNNASAIWKPTSRPFSQSIWNWLSNWRNQSRPTISHQSWWNRTILSNN